MTLPPRLFIDVIQRLVRAGHGPQLAVFAVHSPAGFIGVDDRGTTHLQHQFLIVLIEPFGHALNLPGDRRRG